MSKSIFFSPTGISSLDAALHGGIGKSMVTHIYGGNGIGRTTLAVQIAASMVNYHFQTVYATTLPLASDLIYEYHLNRRTQYLSYCEIRSLNGFEVLAASLHRADFIILDGTDVYYEPSIQKCIEKTHSRDRIRTMEEIKLAALARIVRVAQRFEKRLVICSNEIKFSGSELSRTSNPSKHLCEVQGVDSTVIELIDTPLSHRLDLQFPQELVVHRCHQIAPIASRHLTLMYNSSPHCFFDCPD